MRSSESSSSRRTDSITPECFTTFSSSSRAASKSIPFSVSLSGSASGSPSNGVTSPCRSSMCFDSQLNASPKPASSSTGGLSSSDRFREISIACTSSSRIPRALRATSPSKSIAKISACIRAATRICWRWSCSNPDRRRRSRCSASVTSAASARS